MPSPKVEPVVLSHEERLVLQRRYAHITLAMLAHAWLAVSRSLATEGEPARANQA
jgi:hypothetical protein